MELYRHYVMGICSHRTQAEKIFSYLVSRGVSHKFMRIFDNYSLLPVVTNIENKTGSLTNTGLRMLQGVKAIPAEVTLIFKSSLTPLLAALGWELHRGGDGLGNYPVPRSASELVHDLVFNSHIVISVETSSQEESALVCEVVQGVVDDVQCAS